MAASTELDFDSCLTMCRFREDGKDSMKFYTDSTYFFELWREEMQKETENQRNQLRARAGGRRVSFTFRSFLPYISAVHKSGFILLNL